jgi:hypothetical protein
MDFFIVMFLHAMLDARAVPMFSSTSQAAPACRIGVFSLRSEAAASSGASDASWDRSWMGVERWDQLFEMTADGRASAPFVRTWHITCQSVAGFERPAACSHQPHGNL